MPVGPFSRYRNLSTVESIHPIQGKIRSLPIRRLPLSESSSENRSHQFASYETADLLALRYLGREDTYYALLDTNKGKLPDRFEPGERLAIPPVNMVNRIQIPGR